MEVTPLSAQTSFKDQIQRARTAAAPVKRDSFNSSSFNVSRELNDLGINLQESRIELSGENARFSFSLMGGSEFKIDINGYSYSDFRSGVVNLSFSFSRKVIEQGKEETKLFNADLRLSFKSNISISETKKTKKEEILDFLMRVVNEVMTKVNKEEKNIWAIVFDPEDLKEIAQLGDSKFSKLLFSLIDIIRMVIEAKKLANKNSRADGEIYNPKRHKTDYIEKTEKREISVEYSLSVREAGENKSTPK